MPDETEATESPTLDVFAAFAEADFGQPEPTPAPVTPPASEEPAADEQDEAEAETPSGQNPNGPGNRAAALREARAETRAVKAQLEATNTRLAAFEQARYQQQEQQRQQQERDRLTDAIEQMDPDDVPAFLQRERDKEVAQARQHGQVQASWNRMLDSQDAARLTLTDYDAQIQKLGDLFGMPLVAHWAQQQPGSPALAAYKAGQSIFTKFDLDAAREEGRQEALKALPQRGTAKPTSAPRLANIPSSGSPQPRDPAGRFDKQLAKGGDVSGAVAGLFAQANFG